MLNTVLDFFINSAHADAAIPAMQTSSTQQPPSSFPMMAMLLVFVVFMYFAVWRPQSKRAKEQRNLLSSLAKGDEVMTAGGILGRISKITDNHLVLTIGENTDIVIQKSSIVSALPKGTLKTIQ